MDSGSNRPTPRKTGLRFVKRTAWSLLRIYVLLCLGVMIVQRHMLYFPTHEPASLAKSYGLAEWVCRGEIIGFKREAPSPKRIWLLLHGNGGQAMDRIYTLPSFNDDDSVFILEYPGYGTRTGSPSQDAFNDAAKAAYEFLQQTYPHKLMFWLNRWGAGRVVIWQACLIRPSVWHSLFRLIAWSMSHRKNSHFFQSG